MKASLTLSITGLVIGQNSVDDICIDTEMTMTTDELRDYLVSIPTIINSLMETAHDCQNQNQTSAKDCCQKQRTDDPNPNPSNR